MEDQFVSYEIAKQLKELGFNEPCFKFWNDGHLDDCHESYRINQKTIYETHNGILAPLYQQVINWFREKHEIKIIEDEYFCDFGNYWFVKHLQVKEKFHSLYQAIECAISIIKLKNKREIYGLYLGQKVYHSDIYNGRELMTIVGIRRNEVELLGDYSGGTHNVPQQQWMPLEGLLFK